MKCFKVVVFLLMWPISSFADDDMLTGDPLPKIEAGFVLGAFHLPDYPGADQGRLRFLPLPFIIYRGDVLRSDRDGGLRGRFLNSENAEFDLSFGAAFPVDGKDNRAREGMPNLDWVGEIGPRYTYFLYRTRMVRLDLRVPLRYVFSTNFNRFKSRGFLFAPGISFRHRALFSPQGLFSAKLGVSYATTELMNYFYGVRPQYETIERATYAAQSGYFGSNLSVSYIQMFKRDITAFGGVSVNSYASAKNRESPLLREKLTTSYFLGLSWGFYKSSELEGGI